MVLPLALFHPKDVFQHCYKNVHYVLDHNDTLRYAKLGVTAPPVAFEKNILIVEVRYRGDISLNDTPSPTPRIIPNGDVLTGPLNGWGDPEQVLDLYENLKYHGLLQQDPIIGLWSGDASMFSKEVMFKVATGYIEGEVTHRGNLHQSDMDSEILWNLRAKGKELRLIEAPYFHIYHGDRPPRDTTHSRLKYTYQYLKN